MIFQKHLITLICVSLFFSAESRVIIKGDANAAAGKSFSFNVFPSAGVDNIFYVARTDATDNASADSIREFSLSGFVAGNTTFLPLAPARVHLNGTADQTNPLIGQKIASLTTFKTTPLVVPSDTPTSLYWISSRLGSTTTSMSSITTIKDAQGAQNADGSATAGIVQIAASPNFIFAAVKKSGGNFTQVGAGIALIQSSNQGLFQAAAVLNDTGIKSIPLDCNQNFLKIGTAGTLTGSVIDMHWDELLQRLYVVFQVTGGAGATDGVVGVAMGYCPIIESKNQAGMTVGNPKLVLAGFIPTGLVQNTTSIVAGIGTSTFAKLQKVRVMHTSTGLCYLIIAGNCSSVNSFNLAYALPIVDKRLTNPRSSSWRTDASHGVLASKVINPGNNLVTFYDRSITPALIRGRAFQIAPNSNSELTIESDKAAKIGGGITIGAIQDIDVYKDTVFASTVAESGDVAGIFYSQALFDSYGAIKGWTPWQRIISAPNSSTNLYGMHFEPSQGRIFALQGASSTTIDTALTSTWGPADSDGILGGTTTDSTVGLNTLLQNTFEASGGMFGLFDFPKNTFGFSTTAGQRTSLMIATGYKKITLVETGSDDGDNNFIPRIGSFLGTNNKTFTGGSISSAPTSNTSMITMSGGALNTIGAITSATIGNETTNDYGMYIVVGGTGGLAVLRATNGVGSALLQESFNGLNDFSWISLGNYTNIRKLLCDGQNLYVLTSTTFDRIPLAQLHENTLTPYTIATPTSLALPQFGSFSDVIVSSDFALLAASNGLYTTGSEGVVSTATTTAHPLWKSYKLSEGPLAITRLTALTTTGFAYDVAKNTVGGQIDVLASSVGQKLSSIYRLAVSDATGGVTSTTLQSIPDGILAGITGPYVHLGDYKNYYATDGAVPLVTQSQYLQKPAILQAFPPELGAGTSFTGVIKRHIQTIPFHNSPARVTGIVRNSAVGSNIVVTNSGLQILE